MPTPLQMKIMLSDIIYIQINSKFAVFFYIHIGHFLKKVVAQLTEHDDVIKSTAQRGPALMMFCMGPAPAKAGPGNMTVTHEENAVGFIET